MKKGWSTCHTVASEGLKLDFQMEGSGYDKVG